MQKVKLMNINKESVELKKRDGAKTILTPEQITLKKDTLDEIKKLQKTYDKYIKNFIKINNQKKEDQKKEKFNLFL
jgi:hypothetical protein